MISDIIIQPYERTRPLLAVIVEKIFGIFQFCGDYVGLNRATKKDASLPLPIYGRLSRLA